MSRNRLLLGALVITAGSSSILGFVNSFSGNASGFTPFFWWMGLFTWDDGMVLGTFLFIGCAVLWLKDDSTATGLFLALYGSLRSLIEILYNLNAQFSSIARPWEVSLPVIAATFHLRLIELFVIAQIFWTALCVIASLILLFYIKRYFKR